MFGDRRVRTSTIAVAAVVVGCVFAIARPAPAFAAQIVQPSEAKVVASLDAAGVPLAVTVVANGFRSGALVYVEQCDGVALTSPGWSPTVHCDLGSSPSPAIADAQGVATFASNDRNRAFKPVHRREPAVTVQLPRAGTTRAGEQPGELHGLQSARLDQQYRGDSRPDLRADRPHDHPRGDADDAAARRVADYDETFRRGAGAQAGERFVGPGQTPARRRPARVPRRRQAFRSPPATRPTSGSCRFPTRTFRPATSSSSADCWLPA